MDMFHPSPAAGVEALAPDQADDNGATAEDALGASMDCVVRVACVRVVLYGLGNTNTIPAAVVAAPAPATGPHLVGKAPASSATAASGEGVLLRPRHRRGVSLADSDVTNALALSRSSTQIGHPDASASIALGSVTPAQDLEPFTASAAAAPTRSRASVYPFCELVGVNVELMVCVPLSLALGPLLSLMRQRLTHALLYQ